MRRTAPIKKKQTLQPQNETVQTNMMDISKNINDNDFSLPLWTRSIKWKWYGACKWEKFNDSVHYTNIDPHLKTLSIYYKSTVLQKVIGQNYHLCLRHWQKYASLEAVKCASKCYSVLLLDSVCESCSTALIQSDD